MCLRKLMNFSAGEFRSFSDWIGSGNHFISIFTNLASCDLIHIDHLFRIILDVDIKLQI